MQSLFHPLTVLFAVFNIVSGSNEQVPPSKPMFVNTCNVDGCDQCINGTIGKTVTIGCHTSGGSEPVTVYMYFSQMKVHGYLSGGTYTTSWRVEVEDHLKAIKCEVSNKALVTPLAVSTKLYVMQRPSTPELHLHDLKEDQPINVSCTSKGGRPAGDVSMHISGSPNTSYPLIQTHTSDRSGTYTSTISLTHINREWNGRTITCCVSHETLMTRRCSETASIDYKYPPSSVTIQPPQSISVDRPYHLLKVTCVIKNANPTCTAAWTVKYSAAPNIIKRTYTTQDIDYTTTNVAVVIVSKDDIGKRLECRANCKYFDVVKSDNYLILVPYAPLIEINVSTSTINVTESTAVVLKCTAKSYPGSTISWIKRNQNTSLTEYTCGGRDTMCMRIDDIKHEDSGVYTCLAENRMFAANTKDIEINVLEHQHDGNTAATTVEYDGLDKDNDDMDAYKHFSETKKESNDMPSPVLWPIVGAVTVAVLLFVLGIVIKRVVKKGAADKQMGSSKHEENIQPAQEPDRGPIPPCGLYIDFYTEKRAYTYDVIHDRGQCHQGHADTVAVEGEILYLHPMHSATTALNPPGICQDVDGDYLHPINGTTTTLNPPGIGQDVGGDYLHPIHGTTTTLNLPLICQDVGGDYLHPIHGTTTTLNLPLICQDVDGDYLHPIHKERCITNTLIPKHGPCENMEENNIYEDIE